ncbi:MAG: hypothetical protein AB2705_19940 [Candidatus Thiodiazotropha sp.]
MDLDGLFFDLLDLDFDFIFDRDLDLETDLEFDLDFCSLYFLLSCSCDDTLCFLPELFESGFAVGDLEPDLDLEIDLDLLE